MTGNLKGSLWGDPCHVCKRKIFFAEILGGEAVSNMKGLSAHSRCLKKERLVAELDKVDPELLNSLDDLE